jgi:hypothetical protein
VRARGTRFEDAETRSDSYWYLHEEHCGNIKCEAITFTVYGVGGFVGSKQEREGGGGGRFSAAHADASAFKVAAALAGGCTVAKSRDA